MLRNGLIIAIVNIFCFSSWSMEKANESKCTVEKLDKGQLMLIPAGVNEIYTAATEWIPEEILENSLKNLDKAKDILACRAVNANWFILVHKKIIFKNPEAVGKLMNAKCSLASCSFTLRSKKIFNLQDIYEFSDHLPKHARKCKLVPTRVKELNLANLKLEGWDLSDSTGAVNFKNAYFTKCTFDNVNFRRANFSGAHLKDCLLLKAKCHQACFVDACFTDCDLTEADLDEANIARANFTDCNLEKARFTGLQRLKGAKLDHCDVANCSFLYSTLSGLSAKHVDFEDAKYAALSGVVFEECPSEEESGELSDDEEGNDSDEE